MTCLACGCSSAQTPRGTRDEYRIFRCPACGLEYTDPMRSGRCDERVTRLYEARAGMVGQCLGWYHERFLALGLRPGRLLDLGCGTGDFVAAARRSGFDAEGIDTDAAALNAGRRHHGAIPLHEAAAEDFLQQDATRYDVITFFEVLEHVEDPPGFLRAVRRRLAPDGSIAFSVPNNDSPLLGVYRLLTGAIDVPPHHLTRWSRKALTVLLARGGFRVQALVPLHPALSDLAGDVCRVRLTRLSLPRRVRLGAMLEACLRPLDRPLRTVVSEGRGMFGFAALSPDGSRSAAETPGAAGRP
jgi:2-polyprenyl-3-methyl-5-hydroxy-6-metoxy-1,4-benzoquinol methylase